MSKLSKLFNNPRQFVRDSKLYQRYAGSAKPNGARKPPAPPAPPKSKAHPLPTVNLAAEVKLSDAEVRARSEERRFLRFAASPAAHDRVIARLAAQVAAFMSENGFATRDHAADIHDFLSGYSKNPAAGAARTTARGSLLWLHLLVRAIDPEVIVESGVYKGASLYALRHANPNAKVYAFDIDLSNLTFRDPSIEYFEGDWSKSFPTATGENDLVYFDDHINNCLRVREAYDRGFRHVVFDDSPDIGQLFTWRYPGVPTIQMAFNRTIEPGEYVEWVWKNRQLRYEYRLEDTHGALDLVETVVELPSLSALTGQRTGIQTYVRLKPRQSG